MHESFERRILFVTATRTSIWYLRQPVRSYLVVIACAELGLPHTYTICLLSCLFGNVAEQAS